MTDPRALAVRAIPAGVTFAYGQGSAFTGFADAADIDVVAVWDEVPAGPFPKHVDEWIHHLELSPQLAELHTAIWRTPDLAKRAAAIERFAAAVISGQW